MIKATRFHRFAVILVVTVVGSAIALASPMVPVSVEPPNPLPAPPAPQVKKQTPRKRTTSRRTHKRRRAPTYITSSYAKNITEGDVTAGEDPVVREALVDALGRYNGTAIAIDPDSGRILAMVNQKLALSSGAQPCSTIKVPVALAALREGLVTRDEEVPITRRVKLDLTEALAHSNNTYFEILGRRLGFPKVSHYAQLFGLGELAGWDIPGEQPGMFPSEEIPEELGGVGRMCSFGEGISVTVLQLGAMMAAIANGGTLYYLQHPRTPEELDDFRPIIKRELPIAKLVPEINQGMHEAVTEGTAKYLSRHFTEEAVMGKTGTCSRDKTRLGWFASFANSEYGRIVVVVNLQGSWPSKGSTAADVAGHIYRNLYRGRYFAASQPETAQETSGTLGASH